MESAQAWQQLFDSWPESQPRTGIVITSGQETIPFTSFMTIPGVLALERDRPDSIGARKVLLSFTAITAVKMIDTDDFSKLSEFGFE